MGKYLLGLFAVAMAVSLSAFTSAKSSNVAEKSANLYWFEYNASTEKAGAYVGYGDRSDFLTVDCNKTDGIDCRRGYTIMNLVNSGDPDQGVINDNAHGSQIRKQ